MAWFTPAGRDAPGADYSRAVVAAMAEVCEVVLHRDRPADLGSPDAIFYVLGNDVERHASIFEMSRLHPGIVVLREPSLHRFFLDYYVRRLHRPDLYVTCMAEHYGVQGLAIAHAVLGPWLDRGDAEIEEQYLLRYTLIEEALRSARGAVVHSRWHGELVRGFWKGPVHEASLPEGLFTSPIVARDYAQGLLRFAEQDVPRAGTCPAVHEASRALAERMASQIGEILASLGASPDAPGVEPVIREVSRLLWPPSG